PYKFSKAVLEAVQNGESDRDEYDMIDKLAELSKMPVPSALADLRNKPERFNDVIDKTEQKKYVLEKLGI
ncbi:MAG: threonine synthase, partial [Ruminococcus sp.]|nr:threonine synthase [Ruminococcus sp.]